LISWIRGKTALVFDDNDISPNWLYSRFAKYVISPKYIDRGAMFKMGIRPHQLLTYDGFKENIYIADYTPDPDFLLNIPFRDFVTVRPENIQATYVADGVKSIVPELVQKLVAKGINVLYLPRYQSDKDMVLKSDNVFIPSKPLNGLDVCYYSQAILTGAGSFSREAAVLGTPAVSFFAGKNFLGVDKEMIKRMMVLYSRDPDEIANHVKSAGKREFNQNISKAVQEELFFILQKAMISGD
jgi:predicted glycosyltransferase